MAGKVDANKWLREPMTDPRDRRNYYCVRCGREWREYGEKYRCPYCGNFELLRPGEKNRLKKPGEW